MMRGFLSLTVLVLVLSGCTVVSGEYETMRQTAQARLDAASGSSVQDPVPTSVWSAGSAGSAGSAAQAAPAPEPTAVPMPTLQQPTRFWYAPNPTENEQNYGTVPSGTPVQAIAKYGQGWVQFRIEGYGELWTRTEFAPNGIDTTQLTDYYGGGE